MSPHIWSWDYSMAPHANAAVFVHEMVHVWQSGHGSRNLLRGAYLYVRYRGNYEKSYKYNLDSSTKLSDLNLEQQAAIIEDYYWCPRACCRIATSGRGKLCPITCPMWSN
jgi:hypothetical protein